MTERERFRAIAAWAQAIEAAAPGIVTWEDPQPQSMEDALVEMLDSLDVICPYWRHVMTRGEWYTDLLEQMRQQGKRIRLYSADGPARSFDPFSYYLLPAWHVFGMGGEGSCFWSFTDTGRVSCWNEYPAEGNGPYTPFYLDDTSVTGAKHMEAIREGVEDSEYLTMLGDRVAELEADGVPEDRAVQDRVRIEILDALTDLAAP